VPGTANRDLASVELWQDSLVRSQRRRLLAADARKDHNRKKTASVAVSAAVAAAPMWPSVTATAGDLSKDEASKLAHNLKNNHEERVLLSQGDESTAVAELQRALGIADDGIFGPHTRAAVIAFQKRHGLPATGKVDVKTWLKLFPTDMIVYAPPGAKSALGVNDSDEPEWAAVSTAAAGGDSGTAELGQAVAGRAAKVGHAAATREAAHGKAESRHDPGRPSVHAASIGATGPAVDIGPGPGGSLPGVPGLHGGVLAPGGGGGGGGWVPHFPPLSSFGSAKEMIAAMIRMANKIDSKHYAYRWGGGHNASFSGPYDCSGAVSAVLHAAGLLKAPRVSGGFMRWGAPGPGAVTIYANAGHVYMSILGRFFGTSRANPGGGAGWFKGSRRAGFAVVHVPFSKLHFKGHKKKRTKKKRVRRHKRKNVRQQSGPLNRPATTPPPNSGGTAAPAQPASAPLTTTASAPRAIAPAPAPSAPAATTPNSVPAPAPQQSAGTSAPTAPAPPPAGTPAAGGGSGGSSTPNPVQVPQAPAAPAAPTPAAPAPTAPAPAAPAPAAPAPSAPNGGGSAGQESGTPPAASTPPATPNAPQGQQQPAPSPTGTAQPPAPQAGTQAPDPAPAAAPPKPPAAGEQSGPDSGQGPAPN
jgi:Putative peptidoglycan binding domain